MKPITVASVATRNRVGEQEKSIANIREWCRRAKGRGAELAVFPELSVSGYVHHEVTWDLAERIPGPSTDKLTGVAADLGMVICFGILERDADVTYNTQVLVNAAGVIGKQRKIHMPGNEYLYWRGGFEVEAFDIGKARIGISICYDSLFSELARSLYFKGAEVLVMPFAYNSKPRAHFPEEDIQGLCFRASCYTNGCYGIVCNNAGSRGRNKWEPKGRKFPGWAGVFGPEGEVVAFTRDKGNGEAMVVATLDPKKVAKRRRDTYFIPRCLRPEVYVQINESDQTGRGRPNAQTAETL